MKLELKYLAAYLPYGLKVSQPRLGKIESYLLYGIKYLEYTKEWTVFIDDSRHGDYQNVYLKGIKPILRPLSDLTKEIEVNGERFVLSDRLYYDFDRHGLNGFDFRDIEKTPLEYPFNIVQKLFEWHFDVFGLIEQGLAIDINTIKPTS